MKWEKLANGDWQAKGEKGDFLIWKEGRIWKMRYRNTASNAVIFRNCNKDLRVLKKQCQENYYWEA